GEHTLAIGSNPTAVRRAGIPVGRHLVKVYGRVPYQEPGQRTRYAYRLTEKGRDFLPVLTALRQWGDTWAADEQGPPLVVRHKDCGAPVHAVLRCDDGHDVRRGESLVDAGPGLIRVGPDDS
ncbi:winged helix-turn-helix transcriptional regulator, partial [Streptomyces sp. NPDC005921]